HFFEVALAHVADPQIASHVIKGKAERISQTIEPNLAAAAKTHERIARWNCVIQSRRVSGIHIDAQDFSQERIRVLAIALGIATAAAVAKSYIEETILAKGETAAIVIQKRLVQREENIFSGWVGEICIRGGSSELSDNALKLRSTVARVIHE